MEIKEWKITKKTLLDCLVVNINGSVGINVVRGINQFLWQKPLLSSRKTLIINEAHNLTLIAQNALLKITEESPPHSLVILIIKELEEIIPTLLSRFQKVYFPPVDKKSDISIKNFLEASKKEKLDILKSFLDNENLDVFVQALMSELDKNPIKNVNLLKELSHRWTMISRYNTNKKLQMEAWTRLFH